MTGLALSQSNKSGAEAYQSWADLCIMQLRRADKVWRKTCTFSIAILHTKGNKPGSNPLQNMPTNCSSSRHYGLLSVSSRYQDSADHKSPTCPDCGLCWKIACDTESAVSIATATGMHSRDSTDMADTQHDMSALGLPSPWAAQHTCQAGCLTDKCSLATTVSTFTLTPQSVKGS